MRNRQAFPIALLVRLGSADLHSVGPASRAGPSRDFAESDLQKLPSLSHRPAGPTRLGGPTDRLSGFKAFASAGKKFVDLHLNYESGKEYPLKKVVTPGVPRNETKR